MQRKFKIPNHKKEANKQPTFEQQENTQSWFERGRRALVKGPIQTLEEASSQSENGI